MSKDYFQEGEVVTVLFAHPHKRITEEKEGTVVVATGKYMQILVEDGYLITTEMNGNLMETNTPAVFKRQQKREENVE